MEPRWQPTHGPKMYWENERPKRRGLGRLQIIKRPTSLARRLLQKLSLVSRYQGVDFWNEIDVPSPTGTFECREVGRDASSGHNPSGPNPKHVVDMASGEAPSSEMVIWLIGNSFDSIPVESCIAMNAGPSGGGASTSHRSECHACPARVTPMSVHSGESKSINFHGVNAQRNYLFTGVMSKDGQYVYYDGIFNIAVKPGLRVVWFERARTHRIRCADVLPAIENLRLSL